MNMAAGFLIVNAEGKALLCRRSKYGDMPYTWALPGGKVEEGETPLEAASRECYEELGNFPDGRIGQTRYVHRKPDFAYVTYPYYIAENEFPRTLNNEHTAARWYSLKEALALDDLHPGVREALNTVNNRWQFSNERYAGLRISEISSRIHV